jgi:hypothetical protein
MYKKRLWKRESLSILAPLVAGGEVYLRGTSRDSKRGLWKQNSSVNGGSARGTWREGFFPGGPEGYIREGSGDGHLSP